MLGYIADYYYICVIKQGQMKPSKIKYDPTKSIEKIAEDSGVTEAAVRRYIKTRNIDRKYDEQLILYRKAKGYMKECPDCSWVQLAQYLSVSVNTARKYGEMKKPPQKHPNGKVSALDVLDVKYALFVSVSESQESILRAILAKHLGGEQTFDCDLTVGKGEFYKYSIPLPDLLYDICPQLEGTESLENAHNLPHESISSVVIDLPCAVAGPNQRKRGAYNSFSTINKMYEAYGVMITLAHRLLKTDGILVFKTADFAVKKKPIWASDLAIKYAVETTGFELADKYIYIDRKAVNAVTSSARRAKVPTHAYFLVFRKPKPSTDTEPSASEQPEQ